MQVLLKAQLTTTSDQRIAFLECLHTLTEHSRSEVGCISFDTLEDVTHPNTFVVLGEWNDEVSLDQHEQSEHVAAFKANAGSMIAARQPARVYIIQRATGLNASNISSISS